MRSFVTTHELGKLLRQRKTAKRRRPRRSVDGVDRLENRRLLDGTGLLAGDVNLDGRFSSEDVVLVFTAGKYDTGAEAGWTEGDWNQDRLFNSDDLVFANEAGSYEGPNVPSSLRITEFFATGGSSFLDEDGEQSDWIEIRNVSNSPIDTTGWKLTDSANDLARWELPSMRLESGSYLIVFASGKNRRDPAATLHANFKLAAAGEYLALVAPNSDIVSQFSSEYPAQDDGITYGSRQDGTVGPLAIPTPGAANSSAHFEIADVTASVASGYFTSAFTLSLATPTNNATIRYTLDGSEPTAHHGQVYSGPLQIAESTILRAAAFIGDASSNAITRTLLFVHDVLAQSNESAIADGFPSAWGSRAADYAMDQSIIGQHGSDAYEGRYAANISSELQALPVVSLLIDRDSMFGERGIYSNPNERGAAWERAVSIDYVPQDAATPGFQVEAGIRVQGGISRTASSKLAFRLLFKEAYGPKKLNYPLFGENAASEFNSLTLRASGGDFSGRYIHDAFGRETQLATGNTASHGKLIYLYINGLFWGLYEIVERPDETFASNYFGGDEDDWDVINAGDLGAERDTAISGTLDAWQSLVASTRELEQASDETARTAIYQRILGNYADGTDDPNVETLLDVDNYIDYLIVNWYIKNTDWPHRNFYMMRLRGEESTGFKFVVWDTEFSLDNATAATDLAVFGSTQPLGPSLIFQGLSKTREFKTRFAERLALHTSIGGALYSSSSIEVGSTEPLKNAAADRYQALIYETAIAMAAESARWGDSSSRSPSGNGGTTTPDSPFGEDRHANGIGLGATILSVAQPITPLVSHIDQPDDRDVFSFTPTINLPWTFQLLPVENAIGVHLEIQDATGTVLASGNLQSMVDSLQWNLEANQTYYAVVSAIDPTATGVYGVTSVTSARIPGGGGLPPDDDGETGGIPGGGMPGDDLPDGGDAGNGDLPADGGGTHSGPWTRDEVWRIKVDAVMNDFFPQRLEQFLKDLKSAGLIE